ncbi:potassium transporter TrkA [Sulfolobus acidocaldarius SUSAZ]|nr:potassium transporter TrkA [Sulfolobus acidocaldarius SUSAZ]
MNSIQIYLILATFLVSIGLLISKKVRFDIVGIVSLVVLILIGGISVNQALINLANPAVVVLGSLMVISKTLEKSGFLESFGELISSRLKNKYVIFGTLLVITALSSGFMSDVALTAVLIPVFFYVSKRFNDSPSKYLIPLSFTAILGGRYTIIGTTPNLILDQLWFEKEGKFLPLFQFAPIGLIVVAVGLLAMVIIVRILPSNLTRVGNVEDFKISNYLVEAKVEDGDLIGKSVKYLEKLGVKILDIYPRRISFGPRTILKGDLLLLQVSPDKLSVLTSIQGLKLAPSSEEVKGEDLYELLIPSGSEVVGKTLADLELDFVYGVKVLGISGKFIRGKLSRVTLTPGVILLVQGKEERITKMMNNLGLVPLYKRSVKIFNVKRGVLALSSLGLSIALSLLGINIAEAFLVGLIPVAVMEYREIYRNIEWSILVFVGTYISMGDTLASTGLLTHIPLIGNPIILFFITALVANFVSNTAAAVILGPVALTMSNPLLALTIVAMGSSCTFITPFSHQANLLVSEAGGYRVKDFLLAGSIMLVIVGLVTLLFLGQI